VEYNCPPNQKGCNQLPPVEMPSTRSLLPAATCNMQHLPSYFKLSHSYIYYSPPVCLIEATDSSTPLCSGTRSSTSLFKILCSIPSKHESALSPRRLSLKFKQPLSSLAGRGVPISLIRICIVSRRRAPIPTQCKCTIIRPSRAESKPLPHDTPVTSDVDTAC
jgi:hypothetical protein